MIIDIQRQGWDNWAIPIERSSASLIQLSLFQEEFFCVNLALYVAKNKDFEALIGLEMERQLQNF